MPEEINISPNTGGPIPLQTAIEWTTNFRNQHPGEIKAHFFGSVIIQNILNQGGIGIRMYNAIDNTNAPQIILVGVDAAGHDMTAGIIADLAMPCPNNCDPNSPLQ
ncbi:MAG: hypothetical protein V4613_13910 [Bacteroidota bacterium]